MLSSTNRFDEYANSPNESQVRAMNSNDVCYLFFWFFMYFYCIIQNKIQRFSDVFELNCTKNNQTVNKKKSNVY